ncbi:MAG TPA: hypothetical protein PLO23_08485, partial [Alphaproteobacteria bacterium]|nr:hypothetical protein [Alphaproteobacteria bacterium]
MSMKGGAGFKKLIVETEELFDPPGAEGGSFSPCRYLSHLLHNQDTVMIDKIAREFESLLGTLSETELKNLVRKFTVELQDPQNGMMTLLGQIPDGGGEAEWDEPAKDAELEIMTALSTHYDLEPLLENDDRESQMTYLKNVALHGIPALHHFDKAKNACEKATPPEERVALALPGFMKDIDPDFARNLQEQLGLRKNASHEIDVTRIINVALNNGDEDEEDQKFGRMALIMPGFARPPSPAEQRRKTRQKFDELVDEFKNGGGAGSLDALKELVSEIEDPSLKMAMEMALRDEVKKRHEALSTKPQPSPVEEEETQRLAAFIDTQPDPATLLQKQLQKEAVAVMEMLQAIENGPTQTMDGAPLSQGPALEIITDMRKAYSEAQIALQDNDYTGLVAALDKVAQTYEPEARQMLLDYDMQAAQVEMAQAQLVAQQKADIEFQMAGMEPQSSADSSGPSMSTGMGMGGGGMGGGG